MYTTSQGLAMLIGIIGVAVVLLVAALAVSTFFGGNKQ